MNNLPQVYRIRLLRTWPAVCVFLGVTVGGWISYAAGILLFEHGVSFQKVAWWIVLVLPFLCFLAVVILSGLMTVTVTDDAIILARLDGIFRARWDTIKRIESSWTIYGGNFVYYIVTTEGRRLPFIPDYIDRCDELLQIIQQRSGKRIVSETRTITLTVQEGWQRFVRFFKK